MGIFCFLSVFTIKKKNIYDFDKSSARLNYVARVHRTFNISRHIYRSPVNDDFVCLWHEGFRLSSSTN